MTGKEQTSFIRELCQNVSRELTCKLRERPLPEHWGGHELRMLVAAAFEESAKMSQLHHSQTRYGDRNLRRFRRYREVLRAREDLP
jgi:hypothetical protein